MLIIETVNFFLTPVSKVLETNSWVDRWSTTSMHETFGLWSCKDGQVREESEENKREGMKTKTKVQEEREHISFRIK